MSTGKKNPLVPMGVCATCFVVGVALGVYGGVPRVVGILLAGAPLVLFFWALLRKNA